MNRNVSVLLLRNYTESRNLPQSDVGDVNIEKIKMTKLKSIVVCIKDILLLFSVTLFVLYFKWDFSFQPMTS